VTQPIQAPGVAEMPPQPQLPTKNGAPQNEDWNNVSHINGTPVKVGERNDYLYKFRKTNLTLNPFGPFFGLYDFGVAYAVHQNVAISASITAIKDEMFQVSVTAPVYFRRAFSGPFLEGGLLFRNEHDYYAYDCYDSCSGSNGWIGPQLMMGWHWTFDIGLNIAFAAGVAKRLDDDGDPDFNGYFRVGYAF
jgi:hypothetical protein